MTDEELEVCFIGHTEASTCATAMNTRGRRSVPGAKGKCGERRLLCLEGGVYK